MDRNPEANLHIAITRNNNEKNETDDLSGDTVRLSTPSEEHVQNILADHTTTNTYINQKRVIDGIENNQNTRIDDNNSVVQHSSELGELSGDTIILGSPLHNQQDNKEVIRTPTEKINIESRANEEVTNQNERIVDNANIIQEFDEDEEMDNIEIKNNTINSAALPIGNTNFNLCTPRFLREQKTPEMMPCLEGG